MSLSRQSLKYDDLSSQASEESETKMESELMNTSMTSSISDCYLASNESSRRSTPTAELDAMVTRISTGDSEGFVMDEDDNTLTGFPEGPALVVKIPTPSVTPSEPIGYPSSPPLNTNDLVAALQRVVVTQEHQIFHYEHVNSVPVCVTATSPNNNSVQIFSSRPQPHPQQQISHQEKRPPPTIFDEFNLDECFLKDDELMVEVA